MPSTKLSENSALMFCEGGYARVFRLAVFAVDRHARRRILWQRREADRLAGHRVDAGVGSVRLAFVTGAAKDSATVHGSAR